MITSNCISLQVLSQHIILLSNLQLMKEKQHPIGPRTKLADFIDGYPNQCLHENFRLLEMNFPNHRTVKGDGNCFYRAFAFLYLSRISLDSYKQAFPYAKLNYSKAGSIFKSDGIFQRKLKEMWVEHITPLKNVQDQQQKQNMIAKLFNELDTFDELMIAYLRSANYSHILQKRSELIPFLRGSQDYSKLLQRVCEFGTESEGIQIFSLAQRMRTRITIFCVDGQGLQPVQYMGHLENQNFYLFYRPGHYDIVYPGNDYEPQHSGQSIGTFQTQQELHKEWTFKSILLGSFQHGPMGRLWVDTIIIGSLSCMAYYLYPYL